MNGRWQTLRERLPLHAASDPSELARLPAARTEMQLAPTRRLSWASVRWAASAVLPAAVLALGLALAALDAFLSVQAGSPPVYVVLGVLVGVSFIAAGLVAWTRDRANRTGALMIAVGLLWFLGRFGIASDPTLRTIGTWVGQLHLAVFIHLLLAFPAGRLDSTAVRLLVGAAYLNVVVLDHAPQLFSIEAAARMVSLSGVVNALIFAGVLGFLVHRWHGGSEPWRRRVGPLLWLGAIALATLVLFFVNEILAEPIANPPFWLFLAAYAGFPVLFLVGLLRIRLARASVAELLLELERPMAPHELRAALARAFGDSTVEIAYWLADEHRYVDLDGQAMTVPPQSQARAVTLVEREGRRVAAIVHDRALDDDPQMLRAAAAAAALALDNASLQAALGARLQELAASRRRIVQAADDERKRIERNLHDGTQQRLTSIALELALAASKMSSDPGAAGQALDHARSGLATALAELRDLSQGIHPGNLTERGLGPSVEDLAYASPLPIRVVNNLATRLDEPIEAAAYYIVAEALANVTKHASAKHVSVGLEQEPGRLVVTVSDDGVGGAEIGSGTGLKGLTDRVSALGGSFELESLSGRGTTVRAVIPCG
jgi:signal transduction histidine kinase